MIPSYLRACAVAALLLPALTAATAQTGRQDGTLAASGPTATAASKLSSSDEPANAAMWERAQRMYAANDFAQASAAATRINSPSLKKVAAVMLNQIQAYVAALQTGAAAEGQKDPIAAIKAYAAAARIKNDGPGDPAGRIARIQQQAAANAASEKLAEKDKVAQRAQMHRARAVMLAHKAAAQEAAGNLDAALASYQAAQAQDPADAGSAAAVARLTARLHQSAPTTTESSPASAIRAFYAGHYAEAEQQLNSYIQHPGSPYSGAAFFYLGASRFCQDLLNANTTPARAASNPAVVDAFHHARALGYAPLQQFVSPTLLEAWKHTS